MWLFTSKSFLSVVADKDQPDGPKLLVRSRVQGDIEEVFPDADVTEPPPTKVEGFSGLERLRRTVGSFPTEVGGFKPDFWKMKHHRAITAFENGLPEKKLHKRFHGTWTNSTILTLKTV